MKNTPASPHSQYTIADRVQLIQQVLGVSVQEMASRAEISHTTVYRWMNQDRIPSNRTVDFFCKANGVNTRWLLFGEGSMLVGGGDGASDSAPTIVWPSSSQDVAGKLDAIIQRLDRLNELLAAKAI